jgi:hypothetical protein
MVYATIGRVQKVQVPAPLARYISLASWPLADIRKTPASLPEIDRMN